MLDTTIDDSFAWQVPAQGVLHEPAEPLATFGTIDDLAGSSRPYLLDLREVAALLSVSVATVKRMVHRPALKFPSGYKLAGLRARRWKYDEVVAWTDANLKAVPPGETVDTIGD